MNQYKGIFVGPVSNKTLDLLLKGQFWDFQEDEFKRLNFETELKKYYDQAEDTWNISTDELDDNLEAAFKDLFKKELRKYDDEVEKLTLTYTKVLKSLYVDYPIYRLKEMVERYKGWED